MSLFRKMFLAQSSGKQKKGFLEVLKNPIQSQGHFSWAYET